MEFPKDSKGSCREKPRQAGGPARASALCAVVFSAIGFDLAENVRRPGAQNVMGPKDFIGAGGRQWGRVYGRPREVGNGTICDNNHQGKNQSMNLPFRGMLVKAASRRQLSEGAPLGGQRRS